MTMKELGLEIYFNNDAKSPNLVFDEDENTSYKYYAGHMLLEMLNDEVVDIYIERVKRMIISYPRAKEVIDAENIADCLNWLFVATYDDYPAASALFRRIMYDTVSDCITEYDSFSGVTVEKFYNFCYEKYLYELEKFYFYLDAIVANAKGDIDESQRKCLEQLELYATEIYDSYTKNCRVKYGENGIERTTIPITTWHELLLFEYCRLKKENKAIKICQHCGKVFIPDNRTNITIYCNGVSPEDSSKTCREVGPYYKRVEKRNNDPELKEYHNITSKLYMRIQRARTYNFSEKDIDKIYEAIKEVKDNHKKALQNRKEDNNEEMH